MAANLLSNGQSFDSAVETVSTAITSLWTDHTEGDFFNLKDNDDENDENDMTVSTASTPHTNTFDSKYRRSSQRSLCQRRW